jgi:S-adenosylmethionine decarboxylase
MPYEASVGTHLLVNLYNVSDKLLEHLVVGLPLLDKIVDELKLTVVSQTGHQFNPLGYSYAYVLSESHFTIHTYPEFRSCYIDIFCCNPNFDSHRAVDIIKATFGSDSAKYQIVKR